MLEFISKLIFVRARRLSLCLRTRPASYFVFFASFLLFVAVRSKQARVFAIVGFVAFHAHKKHTCDTSNIKTIENEVKLPTYLAHKTTTFLHRIIFLCVLRPLIASKK